ncbi:hypothetical protein KUW17_03370 [Leisingera aquaemixtae]|uniref:imm11 family protein n=1 Tax=Leisingera aquaemixtae TaxID=1396826 RepID=UPI001C97C4D3|nr:DUF1629 domain-containing protein [Leisingera aquaemixtae]MBY6065764.1 hypothetical protein [Leisingera aquaemixtae]
MPSLPSVKEQIQKPENCRTVYRYKPDLVDAQDFPVAFEPDVDSYSRKRAGFRTDAHLLELPGTPGKAMVYRPSDMSGCPEQIGSVRLARNSVPEFLPDCLSISGNPVISASLKQAIQAADPDGAHQFIPCMMYNAKGQRISSQDYYHFVCGRTVFLLDQDKQYGQLRGDATPSFQKEMFDSLGRARFLSYLPVWCHKASGGLPIFFSQEAFGHIRAANLRGFGEFTKYNGRDKQPDGTPAETVAHIWVDMDG